MAKKKSIKEEKQVSNTHTCGDCGNGTYYYDAGNLDLDGNPICLSCPFTENRKRIRSERACDKWKPINKK